MTAWGSGLCEVVQFIFEGIFGFEDSTERGEQAGHGGAAPGGQGESNSTGVTRPHRQQLWTSRSPSCLVHPVCVYQPNQDRSRGKEVAGRKSCDNQ